ncbi:MAG: phosphotransferase [Chloroflexota bacterium]
MALDQEDLPLIEQQELTEVVRAVLDRHTAVLTNCHVQPLHGGMGPVTHGTYRLSGTALDSGCELSWSVILKIISLNVPGTHFMFEDEAHPLYWKREALAYGSGLLNNLPGGVTAPRCYRITEQNSSTTWLWLEDVQDAHPAGWSLEQYALAARCLGRFNGSYLAGLPMPTQPWLVSTGSPRGVIEYNAWLRDLIVGTSTWQHPFVRELFPVPVAARLFRLWDERDRLLRSIESAPQTFCHHDATRRNLFVQSAVAGTESLALIDWAYPGFSAVGTDAADLFGASYNLPELGDTPPRLLDRTIFHGYIEGLHEAGWQGDPLLVRLVFAAFSALKCGLMLVWLRDLPDAARHPIWERMVDSSYESYAQRQARMLYYLLDLADEARTLLARMS